jgi:hypothetical protein
MYDVTMEGANIDQIVLMMMVYEQMPSIWNKLAGGKCFWECEQTDSMPPITLVTSHWFLTLFINIVPIEVKKKKKKALMMVIRTNSSLHRLYFESGIASSCKSAVIPLIDMF